MKYCRISLSLIGLIFSTTIFSQQQLKDSQIEHNLRPKIEITLLDKELNLPISDAKIIIKELGLEGYTNVEGKIQFNNIPIKPYTISVEHGDYLIQDFNLGTTQDQFIFKISANHLNLKEVVILGQEGNKNGSTSTVINRKAIEHLQATSLQEVLQLVPGNIVNNPSFTNANQANIRQYEADKLGSLGTAVIVNGANISNNANLQVTNSAKSGSSASFSSSSGGGTDLRQINADNIESVEVIRGIPSVEYGDLSSGAIIVQTKARKEPLQIKARFNPALTQYWAGKGFEFKNNGGTLFVDADYTKSNDRETNKYQHYTRTTASAQYTNRFGKNKNWRTNTTLAYTLAKDLYDMDPDRTFDSIKNQAKDNFIRFSTNGIIDRNKKFSRTIKYNLAVNYGKQKGYQQQYYTADVTAESYATTNGTNEVDYLPSSYLSKMWVDGKPLTIAAKIINQFYALTGGINHSVISGVDWNMDANYGNGKTFTRPPRNTDGSAYRQRAYKDIPALHQFGLYVQDHLTTSLGDNSLEVIAGLRYDLVQPFQSNYNLQALSPRVNASFKMLNGLTFRGGYGISSKAPILLYLYPEPAYFDFYSINHYAQNPDERLAMITTHVYDSQNNQLKLAKTNKAELGFTFEWGKTSKKRFGVTAFHEKTKNGYSMSTILNSIQFAQTPIYSVINQPIGQRPILSDDIGNKTTFVSYYSPTNNINRTNKGIEFELDLGRLEAINTTFNINGAFISTKSVSNNNYILQQNVAGRETTRIGVFAPGRGSVDERFVTTIRAVHHIPQLGFIATLSAQTIWVDQNKFLGYESQPIGYIPIQAEGEPSIIYFTDAERQAINKIDDPDLYLSINDGYYKTEKWNPLWLFNIKLTKEFKRGLSFSFYANNFVNYRPLENSSRYPTTYYERNIDFFFGSEISIKF